MGKFGVGLVCDVADDLGRLHTDEAKVRQIVTNLLSNALKFTEAGEVRISALTEDGNCVISVRDTGIGIPPEALDTVFDEFRQVDGTHARKYQGTGLGLSITKKLAELLGGTIAVESEMDKGSVFAVTLPTTYRML